MSIAVIGERELQDVLEIAGQNDVASPMRKTRPVRKSHLNSRVWLGGSPSGVETTLRGAQVANHSRARAEST